MRSTGLAMIGGEITTNAYVDFQTIARDTIREIGYTKAEYKFDAESCSRRADPASHAANVFRGRTFVVDAQARRCRTLGPA